VSQIPRFSSDAALNATLRALTERDAPPPVKTPPAPKGPEKPPEPPPALSLEWDPAPRTKQEAIDQLARARRRAERLFAFTVANARCSACTAHQAAAREIVLRLTGRRI
jgi:hypothetical protein